VKVAFNIFYSAIIYPYGIQCDIPGLGYIFPEAEATDEADLLESITKDMFVIGTLYNGNRWTN
jgi:hypothetical protein